MDKSLWVRFLLKSAVCFIVIISVFTGALLMVCYDTTNFHFTPGFSDVTRAEKFRNRFYYAASTLSTCAYGDMRPVSNAARSMSIAAMLICAWLLFTALAIGFSANRP